MNSFLTQWIAELFQGAYISGNYGSQLFSTRAHLSFALIFFLLQYLIPSRFKKKAAETFCHPTQSLKVAIAQSDLKN